MARVMITNGNNFHPADYHAEVTAEKIVVIGENASPELIQASRAFRKAVEAILVSHHTVVESTEQAALAEHGAARYDHCLHQCALDATDESVMVEIAAASRGTVLEAHFHRADVQAAILQELHHETRSQMNVHREVHKAAAKLAVS
jgi:hypothetical protein